MPQKIFVKAVLVAAMGLGGGYTLTAHAAEVGNMINSDDGRFKISINAERSKRDVKQSGRWDTEHFSEFVSPSEGPPGTEYRTESYTESISGLKGEEDQDHLYLKLSYAVTPKIEVYGKLGAAKSKLKLDGDFSLTETETWEFFDENDNSLGSFTESFSENVTNGSSSAQRSDTGILAGIGVKAVIHEWASSGWKLILDAQYQYKKMGDSPFAFSEFTELGDDVVSKEAQGSIMFAKNTGAFRPYVGLSYTKLDMEYDSFQIYGSFMGRPDIRTTTVKFENEDKVGAFAGFEYSSSPDFGFGGGIRVGADTALNLNVYKNF